MNFKLETKSTKFAKYIYRFFIIGYYDLKFKLILINMIIKRCIIIKFNDEKMFISLNDVTRGVLISNTDQTSRRVYPRFNGELTSGCNRNNDF
ncbi:hypothetical protein BpHYR1_035385 [Brachionus plicatilis]|uniref:Uncharacterized protein n=1 Tax=Brachionus plicatilis TaxID=10195 RepID=A0A3M7PR14_BRAPC|nr:hypothetical protein BpHYR1_035385 [Brachionus plicatilis]